MAEGMTADRARQQRARSDNNARPIDRAMAVNEIEQYATILAVETTPANAAEELRRIADELEALQPQAN